MRTIQTIKNQYDNVMKPLEWTERVAQNFAKSIMKPIIVEKKDMIPQWKIANVNNTKRCTESMVSTDVLILDFDDPGYSIKEFEDTYRGYKFILHTSHSYDGTNQKFRVFLFLDKEYDINRLFFKGYHKQFSPYYFLVKQFEHIDPASFVKAQFFKVPAIKAKGSPYYYKFNNGEKFDLEKNLGFEFKIAFDNCVEKQEEHMRKLEKQAEKWRKKNGGDLTKAKDYITEKIETCGEGGRHNTIFALACWWKKIGGTFAEFESIMPSWADTSFKKQLVHLSREWARLK